MGIQFQDYYQTLGVGRTASFDEIKQAFRNLARRYHPDVAANKVSGEAKFKEINEAYEVLGDTAKRRRYDELGANWEDAEATGAGRGAERRSGPRSASGAPDFEFSGTGFSDFFESFFGGGRGRFWANDSADGRHGDPREGGDVEADLLVTFEEALRGAVRTVTLRRPGENGSEDRTDAYHVRIPAGVREGQRIRLAGQGGRGARGGAAGDLFLRVRLASHPDFGVLAGDLYYDLALAPWEAVLGVSVTIPALDGPTSLRVPPGTAAGCRLRLRGMGLPRSDGVRGDLYATVRIHTPVSVSADERSLWEQLARISPFKPRISP